MTTTSTILRSGLSLIPIWLVASLASASPNDASGIYLTAADYQRGHLTAQSDCQSPGHTIELHDVLNKPYIHVAHGGERRQYAKSEVYGFRTCDGRDYRFVANREYRILEARIAVVYSVQLPDREGEDLFVGKQEVFDYFFSVGAEGPILRLTRDNLKQAFPDNHRFHDALDQTFTADAQLAQYDDFHKMFKINRLLVASSAAGQ